MIAVRTDKNTLFESGSPSASELATKFASCECDGNTCESCHLSFAALHEKQHLFLLRHIENLPAVRRHSGNYGPLSAGPIANRIWEKFRKDPKAWLLARNRTKPKAPTSLGDFLRREIAKEVMPEFVGEPVRRRRLKRTPVEDILELPDSTPDHQGRIWSMRTDSISSPLRCSFDHRDECDELFDLVVEGIGRTHSATQEAFRLIYDDGFTLTEAATATCVSKSTLQSRFDSLGTIVARDYRLDSESVVVKSMVRKRRGLTAVQQVAA